ncbi:hypothetical protein PINS_up012416 [Pythium insidiosum]|nr:hypothetical protein PINS_up012416 [Pythium insidiosum]
MTSGLDLYPEDAIFDSTKGFSTATNSSTPVDMGSGFISLQDAITTIDGAAHETSTLTPSVAAGTEDAIAATSMWPTPQNASGSSVKAAHESGARTSLTDGSLEHPIVVEAPLFPLVLSSPPASTPAVTTPAPALQVPSTAEREPNSTQSSVQTASSSCSSVAMATSVFTATLLSWFI